MYTKTTYDITITVTPHFLEDETFPEEGRYVWAYHVRIENNSRLKVKLISRKWVILESNGRVQVVGGEGVLGVQPELEPGDFYEYTSGVPLTTPSGFMWGNFYMLTEHEETLDIEIPTFSLDCPGGQLTVH